MKQKQVVFDFDGTIADSFWMTMRNFSQILKRFGFEGMSDEVLEELRGLRLEERMARLGILPVEMKEMVEVNKKEMLEKFFMVEPFKGIKGVLEELRKKGLSVGILTSNLKESVDVFVKWHDFELFDYVYGGSGLFNKKEELEKFMRERGVSKEEMIYVGDEVRDVEGSKAAGVAVIAVSWGYDDRGIIKASKPDYLLDKPEDIIGAVDEIFS